MHDLVNRLAQELAQAQRALAVEKQKVLGATRSLEARMQDLGEARSAMALLLATLDATDEGIVAVSRPGHALHYNSRFLSMWDIAPQRMEGLNDAALLALQLAKVRDPQGLLALVEAHRARPQEAQAGTLELTDGRALQCRIVSHRVLGRRTGTVTRWREVRR